MVKDGMKLQDGSTLEESGIHSNSKISINLEYRVRSPTLSLCIGDTNESRRISSGSDMGMKSGIMRLHENYEKRMKALALGN